METFFQRFRPLHEKHQDPRHRGPEALLPGPDRQVHPRNHQILKMEKKIFFVNMKVKIKRKL